MNKPSKERMLSIVPLLLLLILTLCILCVTVTGIGVARRVSARDDACYALRTACQYTSVKMQQATSNGFVFVEDFGGCDTLVIKESIGGIEYLTRIYCYDGYLRELFSKADAVFSPSDGEKLIKLKSMTIDTSNNLYEIVFTEENGTSRTLTYGGAK